MANALMAEGEGLAVEYRPIGQGMAQDIDQGLGKAWSRASASPHGNGSDQQGCSQAILATALARALRPLKGLEKCAIFKGPLAGS